MRTAKIIKIASEIKYYREKRAEVTKALNKIKNMTFVSVENCRKLKQYTRRIDRYNKIIAKLEAKVI